MNTEEDNNQQKWMSTPTLEAELAVEMNTNILKIIHSLQAELQSLRDDSLNERKEKQAINEALLRNMMGGIPQGKPTQSKNNSKEEPYHKPLASSQPILFSNQRNNDCNTNHLELSQPLWERLMPLTERPQSKCCQHLHLNINT